LKFLLTALSLFALTFLVGCGKPSSAVEEPNEEGPDHGAEGGETSFEEGKGIRLVEESKKALGLTTVEVVTSPIQPVVKLTAQVYQTAEETVGATSALASATAEPEIAEQLEADVPVTFDANGRSLEGFVRSIDSMQRATIGKVEILLELPDPTHRLAIGAFVPVSVRLPSVEATAVPRSAVLETSTGKFAYVRNGEFYLRTPITTGSESSELIEITDGLYDGDIVVSNPVEPLYLTELRATKGGGHCH